MKSIFYTVAFIFVLTFSQTVSAQLCGDVNDDATVNISDLTDIINYITHETPSPIIEANADVDGYAGITISDVHALAAYLYQGGSIDCNATNNYSFAPAPNDTLFIPRALSIPEDIDTVIVVVKAFFDSGVDAFYIPLMPLGSSSGNEFILDNILNNTEIMYIGNTYTNGAMDTTVMTGADLFGVDPFSGYVTLFELMYLRVQPGISDIIPETVQRSNLLKTSFEVNGDLHVPEIVYYDVTSLTNNIIFNPGTLSFTTDINSPATDTTSVSFSSSGEDFSFYLVLREPWMRVEGYDNGSLPWPTYSTPVSVNISVDGTGYGVMDYTGYIVIYNNGPIGGDTPMDSILVTMSVEDFEEPTYPAGDFNCDGQVTMSDLVYLVSYMFLGGPAPEFCQ